MLIRKLSIVYFVILPQPRKFRQLILSSLNLEKQREKLSFSCSNIAILPLVSRTLEMSLTTLSDA